jgi:protein-arginine kinase activator protein McsA
MKKMKKFTLILFCLISTSLVSQEKFKSLMDRYYIKDTSKGFYTKIRHDNTKIFSHDDYKTTIVDHVNTIDSVKVVGVPIKGLSYIYVKYKSKFGYILLSYFEEQEQIKLFKSKLLVESKIREKELKIKRRKLDSIKKIERIKKELKQRKKCSYSENTFDAFDNKKRLGTGYDFIRDKSGISSYFNIRLLKRGKQKYIKILDINIVGCASPYKTNRSTVKFKLTNNKVVTFYHRGSIECGSFDFLGSLTNSDILALKSHPIKSIRITGTDGYFDYGNLDWSTYFIDQLKCID